MLFSWLVGLYVCSTVVDPQNTFMFEQLFSASVDKWRATETRTETRINAVQFPKVTRQSITLRRWSNENIVNLKKINRINFGLCL